jgi:hypothetical protein
MVETTEIANGEWNLPVCWIVRNPPIGALFGDKRVFLLVIECF